MANYTIKAVALQDLLISGPDPFSSDASANFDAASYRTTITVPKDADWTSLMVHDDEGNFHDSDSDQELVAPTGFAGSIWSTGTDVAIEYSYVIRPLGATDPAEDITIFALQLDGHVVGMTATAGLERGAAYEIIYVGSQDPTVAYSQLVVCFAEGTGIVTPSGRRPADALRAGDLVDTLDHGPLPLAWVGHHEVAGEGGGRPVRVAPGALDNDETLILSQQHCMLMRPGPDREGEVPVPVKALVGRPGISWAPCERITYHHLLLDGHQVIFAGGAPVESMYPGPMALWAVPESGRRQIEALFPGVTTGAVIWPFARPLIRPGQWARQACRVPAQT